MSLGRVGALKEEADGKADHAALTTAKKNQVASRTVTTKATCTRQGDLGVEVQSKQGDLTDTQSSLAADHELTAKLADSCDGHPSGRNATRAQPRTSSPSTTPAWCPSKQFCRSTTERADRALNDPRRCPKALTALTLNEQGADSFNVTQIPRR